MFSQSKTFDILMDFKKFADGWEISSIQTPET